MIGITVVGGGRIGIMHAQIIARLPEAQLRGVVIRSRQQERLDAAGLTDTPMFGDLDEALADEQTAAVLIASSSDSHVDLIQRAAAAGKHVLCEKPVAFDAATIVAVQQKTATSGLVIQVGFNRRFDPDFARLREMLQHGALGRLYLIQIINMDPQRPPLEFIPRSGGMFGDFNVHDFDMLASLTGQAVVEVHARGANLVDEEIGRLGDIDTAVLSVKMADGTLAVVLCSRETHCGYDQRIEVLGEKGALRVGNILPHSIVSDSPAGSLRANPLPDFIARYRESYQQQILAFLSAIREQSPSPVGLSAAAAAVRCVEAAQRSMAENRSVVV